MAQYVYLDTNSISNLLGRPGKAWTTAGVGRLRDALLSAADDGSVEFVASHYHLEEASRMRADLRGRFVRFLWDIVRWNLLLPANELVVAEAAAGAALDGQDCFDTFDRRQRIRRTTLAAATLDAMAIDVASLVGSNFSAWESRRDEIRKRLTATYAGKAPQEVARAWFDGGADAAISEWVSEYMSTDRGHLKLPADSTVWPEPRQMQTAWAITGYVVARTTLVVGFGEAVVEGDTYDAFHYASACYADVLVTEDRGFRRTMAIIPNNPVTALSLNDFATQFGISPS